MTAERANGNRATFCTFYSYKGGVGRTLALANVGVLLAQWGYRVLCIDWDLEAPGLHLYYEPFVEGVSAGVVELVDSIGHGQDIAWAAHWLPVAAPGTGDRLSLMPAGRLDEHYFARMQALDWDTLYAEHDLGRALEDLRVVLGMSYDFVLIDSRTGVTDIGGVCTVQLPDIVAFLFTANRQSIDGSLEVMRRAEVQRDELPVDRAKLLKLPVVTRWEANVEVDLGRLWLGRLEELLEPTFSRWAHKSLAPASLINHSRLPYVPRWSFGEELPVLAEDVTDQYSLAYALETLAALIANRLEHTDLLVANRQSYVEAAKFAKVTDRDRYEFDAEVLAEGSTDPEFAGAVTDALRRDGWRVRFASDRSQAESAGSQDADLARNLIVVLSEPPSRWVDMQVREFLRAALLEEEDWRLLIPVTRADDVMPRSLRSLQFIDARRRDAKTVARWIAARMEQQRIEQFETSLGVDHEVTVAARAQYLLSLSNAGTPVAHEVLVKAAKQAADVIGPKHPLTGALLALSDPPRRPRGKSADEPRIARSPAGARGIARQMARERTPREAIAQYLRRMFPGFEDSEIEVLLDEVFPGRRDSPQGGLP